MTTKKDMDMTGYGSYAPSRSNQTEILNMAATPDHRTAKALASTTLKDNEPHGNRADTAMEEEKEDMFNRFHHTPVSTRTFLRLV